MSEITVTTVTPQDWAAFKAVRLDALRDSPAAFSATWVSTDNGRAVAFASGLGFRPTDSRRPMRGSNRDGEEEIAMILPLGADRGTLPDLG